MPLYAYIKIPNITGSESGDEDYGKDWISITSMELDNSSDGGDEDFEGALQETQAKREKERVTKLRNWAKAREIKLTASARKEIHDIVGEPRPLRPPKWQASVLDDIGTGIFGSTDPIDDLETLKEMHGRKDTGGSLTVTKFLDSTSPKLQRKCLQCLNYDSDEYIEGKIELHICRQIPSASDTSKASREIYLAYILENCLITSIKFEGSETDKFKETIEIIFEKIHSCIKIGDGWDTKGWDFVTEKEATQAPDPTPPK